METLIYSLILLLSAVVLGYTAYQRLWHPLARFPGPFWASLTDIWNAAITASGQQPSILTALHAEYGPIVRYGPNRLSITSSDGVSSIFIKGFKSMPKTEFYDTFGGTKFPHLFGMRDPSLHAIHRKSFHKFFAPRAIASYESKIDEHLDIFRTKIRHLSEIGMPFDLKSIIYLFMCDVVASLMYGRNLNIQRTGRKNQMPDDHTLAKLNAILGALPGVHFIAPLLLALLPHPQTGFRPRNTISYALEASHWMDERRREIQSGVGLETEDFITKILLAQEADSCKEDLQEHAPDALSFKEVKDELLSFIFAGIHPPAATLDLLLWNLFHNPDILRRAIFEIDNSLPAMTVDRRPYSVAEIETHLPYLRLCVKESARLTPAFAMPLARYVTDDHFFLNDQHIPKGTSVAMSNHVFHHNSNVWGDDHNVYDPARWENDSNGELAKLLLHFGAGGRQCIGKTLATAIIHKLVSTLLSEFTLRLADQDEHERALEGAFHGRLPDLVNVGITDLAGPLNVVAKVR